MWRSKALLVVLSLAVAACANSARVSYDVSPSGERQYALRMSSQDFSSAQHQQELARRASATCGGAYSLAEEDQQELVTVCTDACDAPVSIRTTATLLCEKASG